MSPKERYDELYEQATEPLPHYDDVIRQAYVDALNEVNERPVLDLDDLPC